MQRASAFTLLLLTTSAALSGVAACDGDDSTALPPFDGGTSAVGESSVPISEAGMMGDSFVPPLGDAGTDSSLPGVTASLLKLFDATQLPDGVAVLGGEVFVSIPSTGAIINVHPDGTTRPYAQLPVVANKGKTLGLAFDAAGNLYAAHTASSPPSPVSSPAGIFKIPAGGTDGGTVAGAPWAAGSSTAIMKNPNGLAFDDAGNLFVTDTGGSVFKIPAAGGAVAAPWTSDAKLGTTGACPGASATPTGANGLAFDAAGQALYVSNTDRGAIVKIPVIAAGAAGAASDLVVDCGNLNGADGMWFDTRGQFLGVLVPGQDRVLRANLIGGALSIIFQGSPLDSPVSVAQVLGRQRRPRGPRRSW